MSGPRGRDRQALRWGELEGRVAVVTGAAQGLGLAFATALTDAGASVVAIDEQVSVGSVGAALSLMGDVGEVDDVRRMVDAALAALGGIDILVNNAGRWAPTPVDAPPSRPWPATRRSSGPTPGAPSSCNGPSSAR